MKNLESEIKNLKIKLFLTKMKKEKTILIFNFIIFLLALFSSLNLQWNKNDITINDIMFIVSSIMTVSLVFTNAMLAHICWLNILVKIKNLKQNIFVIIERNFEGNNQEKQTSLIEQKIDVEELKEFLNFFIKINLINKKEKDELLEKYKNLFFEKKYIELLLQVIKEIVENKEEKFKEIFKARKEEKNLEKTIQQMKDKIKFEKFKNE